MLGLSLGDNDGGGSGGGSPLDPMQTFGILNALKTGDARMDMLIAMCIPILLRLVFNWIGSLQNMLNIQNARRFYSRWFEYQHQRFLVHRSTRQSWGGSTSLDEDTQNTVLMKAIHLYLHHKCNLKLKSADIVLTSMDDKTGNSYYYNDYDDDDEDGGNNSKTLAGMLSKYKIVLKPPKGEWHIVGRYGGKSADKTTAKLAPVKMRIEQHEEDVDKEGGGASSRQRCTLTMQFVSTGEDAIDDFIDTAYQWYMEQLRKLEDNSRYMYELKTSDPSSASASSTDDDGGASSGGLLYSRYRLSDEKTFASLFFQQKQSLLRLVEHFSKKTGKYAIQGYPHKLGLLLHGVPGSGKTSMIKALAQHTGRSIVNVSLAKIQSNEQLMNVFFDKKYYIQGENVPVKLGFKDVIFVMEDVDAASKVVKRRRPAQSTSPTAEEEGVAIPFADMPKPKSLWSMMLESNDSSCRELVEKLMTESERLKAEATKPEVLMAMSKQMLTLPGLGFVGMTDDPDASKLGDDACKSADTLMNSWSTVDRFMGNHAQTMLKLLESGAPVTKALEDCLLGDAPCDGKFVHFSNSTATSSPPPEPNVQDPNNGTAQTAASTMGSADDLIMAALSSGFLDQPMPATGGGGGGGGDKKTEASTGMGPSLPWKSKDSLNLAGLLNVLDGVVDSPGRIVIMTTNHPEQLDPALIRPGRIDKKIMLGFMAWEDMAAMLEHYFQTTLNEAQRSRVEAAVEGGRLELTPAQVEQFTAEHDELEEMLEVLDELAMTGGGGKRLDDVFAAE